MKKLILASNSPRRRELLEQIGVEFEVIPSNAEDIRSAGRIRINNIRRAEASVGKERFYEVEL